MIARAIRGHDFYGLVDYLIKDRNLHPDAVRVSPNLLGLDTAAREMTIVAQGNRRCIAPVRHLILAWREDEQPSIEQQHACAEALLDRLGVASHQSIRVAHTEDKTTAQASGDGRHYELHIAVNGVGPTGRAPESTRDWSTVEIATAWVAAEHGFAEIPGRFNGVGAGPASSKNGKARSVAARKEKPTIADDLSADPVRLERLVKARARGMEAGSWDALLEELDRQGLCVERGKDRGSQRVRGLILVDKTDPKRRQKFSALDTPVLKWGEGPLTTDLGSVPRDLSVNAATARKGADQATVEAKSSFDAAPRPNDLEKEIERRMRHERSALRRQFQEEQDRIQQERGRIFMVRKGAWRKFQGRRAELLQFARVRRNLLYWLLPKRRRLRKLLNTRFDQTLNAKLQVARGVYNIEKALPLPVLQCWTTWSASRLRTRVQLRKELLEEIAMAAAEQPSAQNPNGSEPRSSESKQGFAAAYAASRRARSVWALHGSSVRSRLRKLYLKRVREGEPIERLRLEENRAFIRTAWATTADLDRVDFQWNSRARLKETLSSQHLIRELRKSGVSLNAVPDAEALSVSVSALARWIGTARGRDDRLAMVERAAASSRREADAARADREEARRAAEQERQRHVEEIRQRGLAANRNLIRTYWAVDPELNHVVIHCNLGARSAETAPSISLLQELVASGVRLEGIAGGEAIPVSISVLSNWVGTGGDRLARLLMVERAAASSRREADAVRADRDEEARKVAEVERQRQAEETRQRRLLENQDLIRAYWFAGSTSKGDHVPIRWNSTTRRDETIPSKHLAASLEAAGVPLIDWPNKELRYVQIADLAAWIGTESNRADRHLQVKRAADASKRETDVLQSEWQDSAKSRADEEKRATEAKRTEELAMAEIWAGQWVKSAPKSELDPNRIGWVLPPHAMSADEPLQQLIVGIEERPELGAAFRLLAGGYTEISVIADAMAQFLTTNVVPDERSSWDDGGASCHSAHQANRAQQQADIEARAWASAWIATAPRSVLAPDHATWTLSGDTQDDAVFTTLCEWLSRHSTTDVQFSSEERQLAIPIELLRAALEVVAPQHRMQWDRLARACADASRANDDRIDRELADELKRSSRPNEQGPRRIQEALPGSSSSRAASPRIEPPVGFDVAAERVLATFTLDPEGAITVVAQKDVWERVESVTTPEMGLGRAFAKLGLEWDFSPVGVNFPGLARYRAKAEHVATALGKLSPKLHDQIGGMLLAAVNNSENELTRAVAERAKLRGNNAVQQPQAAKSPSKSNQPQIPAITPERD